jgi:enoyl-CoA hydratase/carnithine racemase
MCLSGKLYGGTEAHAWGLADRLCAPDDLLPQALALAGEIAANGRLAVRGAKRALNALSRPGHESAIAFESSVQAVLFDSDDKKARMDAFLSKAKKG